MPRNPNPVGYNANPNLPLPHVNVQLTAEELKEYIRCANDPIHFIQNHVRIVNVDEGIVKFKLWPFQEEIVRSFEENRFVICKLARQSGKALDTDTPILTTNGWTRMGDITPGVRVYGPDGQATAVKWVSDIQTQRTCYELTFDNGDTIVADADHQWEVQHSQGGAHILTTKDLAKTDLSQWHIPMPTPLVCENGELIIDPYVTGVWFNADHIPTTYLLAPYSHRLLFLQGLMDAGGNCNPNGVCTYSHKKKSVVEDVRSLLATCGIKSRLIEHTNTIGEAVFTCEFTTDVPIFRLLSKTTKQKSIPVPVNNTRLFITNIRPVESRPVRCIGVDNDSHLFLCGRNLIPTHNSTVVICGYFLWYILFHADVSAFILANKEATAILLLDRLKQSYELLPDFLKQGIIKWDAKVIKLANNARVRAESTSASAIRGDSANLILLDEFAFVPDNIAVDFMSSVYPTISSGKTTKMFIVSCVTPDTIVLTPNGPATVQRFIDTNQPSSPTLGYDVPEYQVQGAKGFNTGHIMVNSGLSPVYHLEGKLGDLRCSPEHKLWAIRDGRPNWYRAADLQPGDFVATAYDLQQWGSDDTLPSLPVSNKEHNVFNDTYISDALAHFLGMYISEGYARWVVSPTSLEVIGAQIIITTRDDISDTLNALGVTWSCRDGLHYVINSVSLARTMQALGFDFDDRAPNKRIPERLFSCSFRVIQALLRGIFDGDGCATARGGVTLTSTSRTLLKQVHMLLLNAGIASKIRAFSASGTRGGKPGIISRHTGYVLEIHNSRDAARFFDRIGFSFARKQARRQPPASVRPDKGDIIPYGRQYLEAQGITIPARHRNASTPHINRDTFMQLAGQVEGMAEPRLRWNKLTNITVGEPEPVYDFSLNDVPNDPWCHSVVYDGMIGHQTPNGYNLFYKIWNDAVEKRNSYKPIGFTWRDVPGRDEKWAEETRRNLGSEQQFAQEFECCVADTTVTVRNKFTQMIEKLPIGILYHRLLQYVISKFPGYKDN